MPNRGEPPRPGTLPQLFFSIVISITFGSEIESCCLFLSRKKEDKDELMEMEMQNLKAPPLLPTHSFLTP